jgi:prevent-host-death family protein
MPRTWQLQEAKNKLSRVVDEAQRSGPQLITRRGVKTAVVLSFEDYRRLIASRKNLSDFFRESPLAEVELDLERDKSPARKALEL